MGAPTPVRHMHCTNRAGRWTYRIRPAVGSRGLAPCRVWRSALARDRGSKGLAPCRPLGTFPRWGKCLRGLGCKTPCVGLWRHRYALRKRFTKDIFEPSFARVWALTPQTPSILCPIAKYAKDTKGCCEFPPWNPATLSAAAPGVYISSV